MAYKEHPRDLRGDDLYDDGTREFDGVRYREGYQIKRIRRPPKKIPKWAGSLKSIEKHMIKQARRRIRAAYLYYCLGLNASEVAAEMNTTERSIESIIYRLNSDTRKPSASRP